MIKNHYVRRITAFIFIVFMFTVLITSWSDEIAEDMNDYIEQKTYENDNIVIVEELEKQFVDNLWRKEQFIELNGSTARLLNMQGYYSDIGLYIADEKYIVSASEKTSTDYEYEQMIALQEFCDRNDVNLLYVNAPTKYMDDALFSEQFGIETYSNRNADVFLKRIRDAGIATVDLREEISKERLNIYEMFYRTDHHWTVLSGLWAARKISVGLNDYCGYAIDVSLFDEKNYSITEWQECWLGEQGRKIAKSYVGLDNYVLIKPNFETDYLFKGQDEMSEGTFDCFINEEIFNLENDVYKNESWHYAYKIMNCINSKVDFGKILLLGDSYSLVMQPFLSLAVSEMDSLVLRESAGDFCLRDYIKEGGYDTIVICYAQFMIGAHDNPQSANYKMFKFD